MLTDIERTQIEKIPELILTSKEELKSNTLSGKSISASDGVRVLYPDNLPLQTGRWLSLNHDAHGGPTDITDVIKLSKSLTHSDINDNEWTMFIGIETLPAPDTGSDPSIFYLPETMVSVEKISDSMGRLVWFIDGVPSSDTELEFPLIEGNKTTIAIKHRPLSNRRHEIHIILNGEYGSKRIKIFNNHSEERTVYENNNNGKIMLIGGRYESGYGLTYKNEVLTGNFQNFIFTKEFLTDGQISLQFQQPERFIIKDYDNGLLLSDIINLNNIWCWLPLTESSGDYCFDMVDGSAHRIERFSTLETPDAHYQYYDADIRNITDQPYGLQTALLNVDSNGLPIGVK